jgi:hypothetical protein
MGSVILSFLIAMSLALSLAPTPIAPQSSELPYVIDYVSVGEEEETGQYLLISISVRDRIDPGYDDVLRPDPLEIRPLDGQPGSIRPTFWRTGRGTFEAPVNLGHEGSWQIALYPDVPESERGSLPGDVPAETVITVTIPPANWLGSGLLLVMGAGLIAFALFGRKRRRPPKKKLAPVTGGDTWWSG